MPEVIWQHSLERLQDVIPSQQFNTWIKPLQLEVQGDSLNLVAPNRFVMDWVKGKYLEQIQTIVNQLTVDGPSLEIQLSVQQASSNAFAMPTANRFNQGLNKPQAEPAQASVNIERRPALATEPEIVEQRGSDATPSIEPMGPGGQQMSAIEESNTRPEISFAGDPSPADPILNEGLAVNSSEEAAINPILSQAPGIISNAKPVIIGKPPETSDSGASNNPPVNHKNFLNPNFTFDTFVQGKSNQLARAASQQVAENAGKAYNPLFIYGGVGLGKTHIMHAVGNDIVKRNPNAKVVYLHSERFVADMVKALQLNAINEFKRFYRSLDALLIDDIQFFSGKGRTQEEFFHTFNALLEGEQQIILTSDRYPKEIDGLEDRLKSRLGWGLTVAVEPPDLETRVAILMKKAEQSNVVLPPDAAFFIAQKIRSNVRELEGALKRVIANSHFTGHAITTGFIKDSLKDLLALQDKQVSIENIQRTVAEYYKIKIADLHSKRRSRSVARPRQVAMALSKELTNHSLPEIGDAFGGRDHTTVLHACRKVKELRETNIDIREDYKNLLRGLTT